MQQIARREALNGFKGFCPVELRDNRLLLTSRREYSSKYGRRTYFFSSRAAVIQFENDPLRYVPANGGRDIVLKSLTGADRVGKLDHAAWYDDHLFLFTSAESLNRFNQNPSRYAGPIGRQ